MKKITLLVLALLLYGSLFAQKVETFVGLNSGLFSFRGVSAAKTSWINLSEGNTGHTNNPFGAGKGLSYGLSYQIQKVSKRNFVTGISIGYENLRSKTTINAINGFDGQTTFQESASGRSNLANHFINGFPYLGYRILSRPIWMDLTAGLDVGYLANSTEKSKAKGINGTNYNGSLDRTGIHLDVRPRLQLSGGYSRIGAYVGYSYGLTNYRRDWVGGLNECHSELIRFGLMYKLRD